MHSNKQIFPPVRTNKVTNYYSHTEVIKNDPLCTFNDEIQEKI